MFDYHQRVMYILKFMSKISVWSNPFEIQFSTFPFLPREVLIEKFVDSNAFGHMLFSALFFAFRMLAFALSNILARWSAITVKSVLHTATVNKIITRLYISLNIPVCMLEYSGKTSMPSFLISTGIIGYAYTQVSK